MYEVDILNCMRNNISVWAKYCGQTVGARIITYRKGLFSTKIYVEFGSTEGGVYREWLPARKVWL